MDQDRTLSLVCELASLVHETEWCEFKQSYADHQEIGEYISALSNSAALHNKDRAYLVWGVHDQTHELVGTAFRPRSQKVHGEEMENYLARQLRPPIHFTIHEVGHDPARVVLFEIPAASHTPVRFGDFEYIRVGSVKKKLRDHPEKERALWAIFARTKFETGTAVGGLAPNDVLRLIDYTKYFELAQYPLPADSGAILERLVQEQIVVRQSTDRYTITNLGGLLFATSLREFGSLARKALRVIVYKGESRVETVKEQQLGNRGYAVGFQGAVAYILDQLPQNEFVAQALRREFRVYPEIAIRELLANALIHQDLSAEGAGPMVEIFADRMEITNPGKPLIDTLRFIDEPPRSRNEQLAFTMRRMAICEERGSGIDKVVHAVELYQLPAPDFRVTTGATVAVLLGPRGFAGMSRTDRIRACYQHACLWYVSGRRMTNASLRKRLGIEASSYPMASRVIRDATDAKLIKAHGDGTSRKDASYVPFWA